MTTKCDVLIIGGGSVGLSSAYYLLKSGRKVTIVDRKLIGEGSSSGNAGHIVPSHIVPLAAPGIIGTAFKWLADAKNSPFGMKISLDPAYLSWLLQFALSCNASNVTRAIPPLKNLGLLSAANFASIISEEKLNCFYNTEGMLFLFKTEAGLKGGMEDAEVLHKNNMAAKVLDQAAVHECEPLALPDIIGGVHYPGDASLNAVYFLKQLGERVRAMGADVYENSPVTGFETSGGKINRVHTSAGDFEPAQVILAAGAWSPAVVRGLGLNVPVQPARGYSLSMKPTRVMPRQATLLGERRVAVTPMGDWLRFTGRLELSNLDTTPNPRHIAGIERAVREYIRLDEKLTINETWAGLRPTTPDGVPIIGFAKKYSNLLLATGHAMLGLSLGPGTGQVVAELANGSKTSFDLTPFALERFKFPI